ncbi:MAG: hypothetical protein F6K58_08875 [Symploca sp. SIO2E9]|nr:hypothetical protein [Symploca sp. SIO2E9]
MMTDQSQNPQPYWYIKVPQDRFPKAKFDFAQQVAVSYDNGTGELCTDIGEVIGIKYISCGNKSGEWYYLLRILKCDFEPSFVGSIDQEFANESSLVADNTVIEQ